MVFARSSRALLRVLIGCVVWSAGCVGEPRSALGTDGHETAALSARDAAIIAAPSDALDDATPSPADVLGFDVSTRPARHAEVTAYLEALADASPHVTRTVYGETHEGRVLQYLTITSEANHDRLDAIRRSNTALADPRTSGDAKIESQPAIAWMAYCIHGDELSGTDAALLLAYRLAAGTDDAARSMRDTLVIHIDPLQNADGRERYLAQLQTLQGQVENPDYQAMHHVGLWSAGRGNHYLFDLNRDWLAAVHPETRGRIEALRAWNPQLVVDGHEMGALDTFLFDPPREPINPMMSASTMAWRRRFSADQARAFDAFGWSYYTQEWYEEWYPGYTNAWAGLRGAVGILYEQSSTDGTPVTQASGEIVTYHDAVHHQYVSSMANLDTLARNREDVLRAFAEERRAATEGELEGPAYLVIPPVGDGDRFARLVALLDVQGIEHARAADAFRATGVQGVFESVDERTFPAGSLVVTTRQPMHRLMRALLDFDPRMTDDFLARERRSIERREGTLLYDVTAWNLPMAYGLDAAWVDAVDGLQLVPGVAGNPDPAPVFTPAAAYGYLVDATDGASLRALTHLFAADVRVRAATKSFSLGGRRYPVGTLLVRRHENDDAYEALLARISSETGATFVPAATALSDDGWDLGGRRFDLLAEPRVAVASQWPIGTTSFGAVWHDLDVMLGLRVSPVAARNLGRLDLRRYNVLVLSSGFGLSRALGGGAAARLRRWVEDGGTLIAIGAAAEWAATEESKLSGVRLRRTVLDELDVYAEAVDRERSARAVTIDADAVWGDASDDDDQADPPDETDADASAKDDVPAPKKLTGDEAKRADAWHRQFSPSGAFVATDVDTEHWLASGVDARLPALFAGSSVFLSRPPVRTPVRIGPEEGVRLSGLLWPEARRRVADSAWLTAERVGRGQIILFAHDPVFRGYTEGTARLFRNAVLLGPGLGADQPVPW